MSCLIKHCWCSSIEKNSETSFARGQIAGTRAIRILCSVSICVLFIVLYFLHPYVFFYVGRYMSIRSVAYSLTVSGLDLFVYIILCGCVLQLGPQLRRCRARISYLAAISRMFQDVIDQSNAFWLSSYNLASVVGYFICDSVPKLDFSMHYLYFGS